MSCLNLRLFPPTKAWRIFTKKLQLKLNKPKVIKKTKTQYYSAKTCKKLSWPTSLQVHPKKFKIIKRRSTAGNHPHLSLVRKRGDLPLLVELFVEHADSVRNPKACEKIYHSSNSHAVAGCEKNRGLGMHKDGVGNMDGKMGSADEMWESMVMGSSQMERIDERAEEFIAKFRADMQNQEMLARSL